MVKLFKSIKPMEWIIWGVSIVAITVSFFVFENYNYHYLIGALLGVTALIFVSKGNPIGQVLTIVFSVFYGIIAYTYRYYGEMITYLGMTAPMALMAFVSWIRNPYKKGYGEVKINNLSKKEWGIFWLLCASVTAAFYFILGALNTANLIISTASIFTSFAAAYLTVRRNRFYAVAYGANDIVLIVMWVLACRDSLTYLPIVICFAAFFILDGYGFINWSKMMRKQFNESNDEYGTENNVDTETKL